MTDAVLLLEMIVERRIGGLVVYTTTIITQRTMRTNHKGGITP